MLAARYAAADAARHLRHRRPDPWVAFAPDDRQRARGHPRGLPSELFTADDALGWVYQFWQSKRKNEVNKAGKKIGAGDLAPVTQLFTEHYMVRFLLENSLGAWWAARHPESPLLREWEYLRYRDDGTPPPAPSRAGRRRPPRSRSWIPAGLRTLPRRRRRDAPADADGGGGPHRGRRRRRRPRRQPLRPRARPPLHPARRLRPRPRRLEGRRRYRELPVLNIACSGIAVKGQLEDWRRLAGDERTCASPSSACTSSSRTPPSWAASSTRAAPARTSERRPEELLAALDRALASETEDPAAAVFGAAAQGTAKAARLLAGRYWLVATNPPFLGRGQQGSVPAGVPPRHHAQAERQLADRVPRALPR